MTVVIAVLSSAMLLVRKKSTALVAPRQQLGPAFRAQEVRDLQSLIVARPLLTFHKDYPIEIEDGDERDGKQAATRPDLRANRSPPAMTQAGLDDCITHLLLDSDKVPKALMFYHCQRR